MPSAHSRYWGELVGRGTVRPCEYSCGFASGGAVHSGSKRGGCPGCWPGSAKPPNCVRRVGPCRCWHSERVRPLAFQTGYVCINCPRHRCLHRLAWCPPQLDAVDARGAGPFTVGLAHLGLVRFEESPVSCCCSSGCHGLGSRLLWAGSQTASCPGGLTIFTTEKRHYRKQTALSAALNHCKHRKRRR